MAGSKRHPLGGLINAIIDQESDWRPDAVSEDGAVGLMQILPQYADDYGYGVGSLFDMARERGFDVNRRSPADAAGLLRDPVLNEMMGREIFTNLLTHFDGNLEDALTAYNMGAPAYERFQQSGGDRRRLDDEARNYYPGVMANYERLYGESLPPVLSPEMRVVPQPRPSGLLSR